MWFRDELHPEYIEMLANVSKEYLKLYHLSWQPHCPWLIANGKYKLQRSRTSFTLSKSPSCIWIILACALFQMNFGKKLKSWFSAVGKILWDKEISVDLFFCWGRYFQFLIPALLIMQRWSYQVFLYTCVNMTPCLGLVDILVCLDMRKPVSHIQLVHWCMLFLKGSLVSCSKIKQVCIQRQF